MVRRVKAKTGVKAQKKSGRVTDIELATSAPRSGAQSRFLNRELSWLDFNERILALAEDEGRPVLERARFLAIFSRNLDEFFQIRVSGLRGQLVAGVRGGSPDGMTPREQLDAIGTVSWTWWNAKRKSSSDSSAPG